MTMFLLPLINIFFFLDSLSACLIIGTDRLEKNLCLAKACPNYGTCKIDKERLLTECVCLEECNLNDITSMMPDHLKSVKLKIDEPVCGSDGVDYSSVCHLRYSSCKQGKEVKIVYIGKCGKLPIYSQEIQIGLNLFIFY